MLKLSPSAKLRVATSSTSHGRSALLHHHVGASHARALVDDILAKPRRRVTVLTKPTFASGLSTASSVTRSVSATGISLTSCFRNAYSSCVTLPRRHSRSQVMADCAAFAVAPHMLIPSSNPGIILLFIDSECRLQ